MTAHVLLVAKAPVAGLAKTRIGRAVGQVAAADLAAAALLDTIDAVEEFVGSGSRMIALAGELSDAARGREISHRLGSWTVIPQVGETFADRIVAAHDAAARRWGTRTTVAQIGMDTPQLAASDLDALVDPLRQGGRAPAASLGPAEDGGWWGLATSGAGLVGGLTDVPMSTPQTGELTRLAIQRTGVTVTLVHRLMDVDDWSAASRLASACPTLRTAGVVRGLGSPLIAEHAS